MTDKISMDAKYNFGSKFGIGSNYKRGIWAGSKMNHCILREVKIWTVCKS